MNLTFTPVGWEDYLYWQTQDKKTLKKINILIQASLREPFTGIGEPEPLKHDLGGAWSRRIDQKNRLVYDVQEGQIVILQARYHY